MRLAYPITSVFRTLFELKTTLMIMYMFVCIIYQFICDSCIILIYHIFLTNTIFTRSKNYVDRDLDSNLDCNLDRNPQDVPVYMGNSLFNTTKRITLLFIVQSLLHRSLPNIWITIVIQIKCLHGTKFFDPDCHLDRDLDNFALCKQGIGLSCVSAS